MKEGLIHFHVVTLFEDSKGNIWFSNARGGVYRYDGNIEKMNSNDKKASKSSFTLFSMKDGLPDNTANCIAEDKYGNIWFGTEKGASRYNGNLTYKDGNNKMFTNYTVNDGLSDNFINSILCDAKGNIWFATNGGINIYDGKSFVNFTDENNKPFKQVVSLFKDHSGIVWIGSGAKQANGNGLCSYDGKTVKSSITPYFVMYMCEDKKGNLWLAHNKGADNINFSLYNYDRNKFTKIITQNKPDNPVIFGIIEDKIGTIWFGTAKGVCRYDGKSFNYFAD